MARHAGGPGRWMRPRRGPMARGFATSLGFSPLYLRYNSGLHISENGRRLSWLLEELCREWPLRGDASWRSSGTRWAPWSRGAPVTRPPTPTGHGSRARAMSSASAAPNTGSWLEKFVNVGGWALRGLPEPRPFADFLELRSAGIRDLRFGYLRDKDWDGHDPDERLRNRGGAAGAGARHRLPLRLGRAHRERAACRRRASSATSWCGGERERPRSRRTASRSATRATSRARATSTC